MSPARPIDDVPRGWIIPVGGAEEKTKDAVILTRFVRLCGGDGARIAVIPTASELSDTGSRYEAIFRDMGVDAVEVLPYENRSQAEREDWLERLNGCTGIFLTGGNQLRISTILGGTKVAKAIRRLNANGVHVGGTSAGAAILSEHMIAFGKPGPTPRAGKVTLAPGFGLTNRVVIDQHFRQRDRLGRLLSAMAYNPFAVGVGLDENTAAFIDSDNVLHAEGSGAVTVVDASSLEHSSIGTAKDGQALCITGLRLHVLIAGATYNLHTRVAKPPADVLD